MVCHLRRLLGSDGRIQRSSARNTIKQLDAICGPLQTSRSVQFATVRQDVLTQVKSEVLPWTYDIGSADMKTITKKYILDNRTNRGSWTEPQLVALGAGWPPRKGWMRRVLGNPISDENARIFESKIGIKKFRQGQLL